jgi:hypothetical protein
MREIKAPNSYENEGVPFIFLGGSIEMGEAEEWQNRVISALNDCNVTILNPRRDNWNTTIKQSIDDPEFFEQVNWELDALWNSNLIIFYFDPNTKAPITLMELGLMANENNVIVCCPDGYWRKGNVEIVCERYEIPLVNSLEEMITSIRLEIGK